MCKDAHFQCLKLALLGGEFTPPSSLRLTICLDAGFKLVDLLPPRFELLSYISNLLRKLCLCFLDAFVEIKLNLG